MTEQQIQAILSGILECWATLSPAEVKSLLKILIVRGVLPKCACCGEPIFKMEDFSWDHIIAKSKGGPNQIGNMVPMHVWCNVEKGSEVDEKYFCHVDPELLERMLKDVNNKHTRSKKSKETHNDKHRRNHIRANGFDMSYTKLQHRH